MATENQNLSGYNPADFPSPIGKSVSIVASKWNEEITEGLLNGALDFLRAAGMERDQIIIHRVPGAFELPTAAAMSLEYDQVDAVIVVGSVIRGETAHFDYVCQGVTFGVQQVSLKYAKPVIFCVLTDDNIEQSRARSGGQHGNKGVEAAATALQMMALEDKISGGWGTGFNV